MSVTKTTQSYLAAHVSHWQVCIQEPPGFFFRFGGCVQPPCAVTRANIKLIVGWLLGKPHCLVCYKRWIRHVGTEALELLVPLIQLDLIQIHKDQCCDYHVQLQLCVTLCSISHPSYVQHHCTVTALPLQRCSLANPGSSPPALLALSLINSCLLPRAPRRCGSGNDLGDPLAPLCSVSPSPSMGTNVASPKRDLN